LTSGGLGPTADDLTAEVVGAFQGREMMLDEALERRIWAILEPLRRRWPNLDEDAVRAANRKQAVVPRGATILEPVGTAPGLVVPPADGRPGPTVVVLPGPPRELQPMWPVAAATGRSENRACRRDHLPPGDRPAVRHPRVGDRRDAAPGAWPRDRPGRARGDHVPAPWRDRVRHALRASAQGDYERLVALLRERHADTLFSEDGRSVDQLVADGLRARGWTIATAESCTGGLLGGRLTERPGSSDYVQGGLIVYADEAKVALAGVDGELLARHGAVSTEVAEALADGARSRLDADVGVGITGIAGPGGGTEEKPVGLVCFSVAGPDGARLTRSVRLPGGRFDVRDRSTTVALHLVRRLLDGDTDVCA
jgi:nicotinamide-nucleotide amidase